jgi:hypothetical protein
VLAALTTHVPVFHLWRRRRGRRALATTGGPPAESSKQSFPGHLVSGSSSVLGNGTTMRNGSVDQILLQVLLTLYQSLSFGLAREDEPSCVVALNRGFSRPD